MSRWPGAPYSTHPPPHIVPQQQQQPPNTFGMDNTIVPPTATMYPPNQYLHHQQPPHLQQQPQQQQLRHQQQPFETNIPNFNRYYHSNTTTKPYYKKQYQNRNSNTLGEKRKIMSAPLDTIAKKNTPTTTTPPTTITTPTGQIQDNTLAANRIIHLIKQRNNEIHLSMLASLYESEYKTKLCYNGKLKSWLEYQVPQVSFAKQKGGVFVVLNAGEGGGAPATEEPAAAATTAAAAESTLPDADTASVSSPTTKKIKLEPPTNPAPLPLARYVLHHFQSRHGNAEWPTKLPKILLTLHQLFDAADVRPDMAEWYATIQNGSEVGAWNALKVTLTELGLLKAGEGGGYAWDKPTINRWMTASDDVPTPLATEPSDAPSPSDPDDECIDNTFVIDARSQAESFLENDPFFSPSFSPPASQTSEQPIHVAIHYETFKDKLVLAQVKTPESCYLFDCVKLGSETTRKALAALLGNEGIVKLCHRGGRLAEVLRGEETGGAVEKKETEDGDEPTPVVSSTTPAPQSTPPAPIRGLFDAELALEFHGQGPTTSFSSLLQFLSIPGYQPFSYDPSTQPLNQSILRIAAKRINLLWKARDNLKELVGEHGREVVAASDARVAGGSGTLVFNVANAYQITSWELLRQFHPAEDTTRPGPLVMEGSDLLDVLQRCDFPREKMMEGVVDDVTEIVVDKGCLPYGYRSSGETLPIVPDDGFDYFHHLSQTLTPLFPPGRNTIGFDGLLARITSLRSPADSFTGFTIHAPRVVTHSADMIFDLLLGQSCNILLIGGSKSGKTCVLRDAARILAGGRNKVCVVDTWNGVGGEGDVPHKSLGGARRVMVGGQVERQGELMVQCVKGHGTSVLVVDELGSVGGGEAEVKSVEICLAAGARCIAAVSGGSLRRCLKNERYACLLGGVGMSPTTTAAGGFKSHRLREPFFDVLIEFKEGTFDEWDVVLNAGQAVDKVWDGMGYDVQTRTRDPATGEFRLEPGTK